MHTHTHTSRDMYPKHMDMHITCMSHTYVNNFSVLISHTVSIVITEGFLKGFSTILNNGKKSWDQSLGIFLYSYSQFWAVWCEFWEQNPGPLGEQVLLATGPSLQPLFLSYQDSWENKPQFFSVVDTSSVAPDPSLLPPHIRSARKSSSTFIFHPIPLLPHLPCYGVAPNSHPLPKHLHGPPTALLFLALSLSVYEPWGIQSEP